MTTNGDNLRRIADELGIPPRSLAQVRKAMAEAKEQQADTAMARLMLRHGRLTPEARNWLSQEYPQ